jgi:hypothetical protein
MPDSDPAKKTPKANKPDKEAKPGPPPPPPGTLVSNVAPSGAGRSMVFYRRNAKFTHGLEAPEYHVLVV